MEEVEVMSFSVCVQQCPLVRGVREVCCHMTPQHNGFREVFTRDSVLAGFVKGCVGGVACPMICDTSSMCIQLHCMMSIPHQLTINSIDKRAENTYMYHHEICISLTQVTQALTGMNRP